MRFRAIRQPMVITDPVTGEALGHDEASLGDLRPEQVGERFAVGRHTRKYEVERGDIAQLLPYLTGSKSAARSSETAWLQAADFSGHCPVIGWRLIGGL
jgi:hypothetical protein